MGPVYLTCKFCKRDFVRNFNQRARVFCSMECKGKSQIKDRGSDVCKFCVKQFKRRTNKQTFCSFNCSVIYRNKSISQRIATSKAILGKPSPLRGRKRSRESVLKGRLAILGPKHWNWKGGISHKNNASRSCIELKDWRRAVFARDNYACVMCRYRGNRLEADHIKGWSQYPEHRFDVSNGRTLCRPCHASTPNYRGKKQPQNTDK